MTLQEPDYTEHLPLSKIPTPSPPSPSLSHQTFNLENDGIYLGLPVYDTSFRGKTAVLAGANGISGTHMLRAMARHPDIWRRVYALSRRPPMMKLPVEFSKNVQHVAIDLLASPEEVGRELKGAGISEW
jgi:hypothetical protein